MAIILIITFIIIIAVVIISSYMEKNKKKKAEFERQERQRIKEEKEKKQREEEKKQWEESKRRNEEFHSRKRVEFENVVNALPEFKIILSGEKHNRNSSLYIECKNITKATPLNKIKNFIAVDTATTGLKTAGNDIIQLSAIKFKDFVAVEKFNTYIKPRKSIPPEATAINGITNDMVADAPLFYQVINSFNEFIGDFPLVAHNAPFHMKHLYVDGLDSIENKVIYDTLELSKRIYKDAYSYSLEAICNHNSIFVYNLQNAIYGSYACGILFLNLIADRKEMNVSELQQDI